MADDVEQELTAKDLADLGFEQRRHFTDEERLERRRQVMMLRGRRLSMRQIAAHLKVTLQTVWHDLDWIRKHGNDLFGAHPSFDPHAFLYETLCRYEDIESTALRDSMRTGLPVREKMLCLTEARFARQSMVALLMDTGQLQRAPVNVNINLPSAAEIRTAIATVIDEEPPIDITPIRHLPAGSNGHHPDEEPEDATDTSPLAGGGSPEHDPCPDGGEE
jgi:hypothetical protein